VCLTVHLNKQSPDKLGRRRLVDGLHLPRGAELIETMREQDVMCKVRHLLENKTHFLPYIIIKLRAKFLLLQLTINNSQFH